MRLLISLALILALVPVASAQSEAEKQATLKYIASLQDATTGAYKVNPTSQPGLRATSGAMRALKLLNGEVTQKPKVVAFVQSCYDANSGAFAEPGGKPDVTITSIGIMAAVELGIPEDKFPKAVEYLRANAKSFEDVRIAAAGLESLKKKPDWLDSWIKIADGQLNNDGTSGKGDGLARDSASVIAMRLRLGYPVANKSRVVEAIKNGQRADGGWGKAGEKASDAETSYRVMRALMLAKEKPKDAAKLREFLSKCRNSDGGYAVSPGEASSMSGVYYFAYVTKWVTDLSK
jgi:prenyltransferase beta subunit